MPPQRFSSYTSKKIKKTLRNKKQDSIIYSVTNFKLPLPTTLTLSIIKQTSIDACFVQPYIQSNYDTIVSQFNSDFAKICIDLIAYNLKFIKEQDIINNHKDYARNKIPRNSTTNVYGINNTKQVFSENYSEFRTQIMNLLKNNMSYLVPPQDTPSYKLFVKHFLNEGNTLVDNKNNIYKLPITVDKIKYERAFLSLVNTFCKIRDDEKYLEPLFNNLQKLINNENVNIQNQ